MMIAKPNAIPFKRSYWISPGRLLAGCYPGAIDPNEADANLKALMRLGIHTCLDLTEENELNVYGQSLMSYEQKWKRLIGDEDSYHRRPIPDRHIPSLDEMKAILDLIDSEIQRNCPVYLHCLGGLGRTGTVVGCWLARHDVVAGSEVFNHIRRLRKRDPYADLDSHQTIEQREMVRNWRAGE
jgi:protein-tyrosine phosphatase